MHLHTSVASHGKGEALTSIRLSLDVGLSQVSGVPTFACLATRDALRASFPGAYVGILWPWDLELVLPESASQSAPAPFVAPESASQSALTPESSRMLASRAAQASALKRRYTFSCIHHGGYDESGIYCVVECICNAANLPFPDEAARDSFITCWQEAIQRRIDAWHAFLKDHPHQPGTISSVADEYFSALAWMGQKVYVERLAQGHAQGTACLLYTSPSPRD